MIEGIYEPGNRIEIGKHKGDVIDIAIFYTTLVEIDNWIEEDQSTGRIVKVPNNLVIKESVYNYNTGFPFVWNEIKVLVTFESNWEEAKKVMLDTTKEYTDQIEDMEKAIKKLSRKYLIYFSKLTPIVYTKIKESGVELSLRHLTIVKKRRTVSSELQEKILNEFRKAKDIDFAYPTIRYYQKEE